MLHDAKVGCRFLNALSKQLVVNLCLKTIANYWKSYTNGGNKRKRLFRIKGKLIVYKKETPKESQKLHCTNHLNTNNKKHRFKKKQLGLIRLMKVITISLRISTRQRLEYQPKPSRSSPNLAFVCSNR